jgi:hypothetical protein
MRVVAIILIVLVVLVGVGYWGLQIAPKPFEAFGQATPELKTVPLPAGLPQPVERFYRAVYGGRIPVIETAVMTGQGHMKLFGINLPMRMQVYHRAGQEFYRILQPTWFGVPIATLYDTYLNGVAHVDQPGFPDNHPKMNSASNLALWADFNNLPALYLTDARVKWEAIDDTHARLLVPSPEGGQDAFTVTFNPATGRLLATDVARWRNPGDAQKSVWHTVNKDGTGYVSWDSEAPWFNIQITETLVNVDVSRYFTGSAK